MTAWVDEVLESREITDDEIQQVEALLSFAPLDNERKAFLRSLDSVDVSACPGSGKTSLVTAKMLLVDSKWSSSSRGMLLLSHTNVAKDEISVRFTDAGKALSSQGRPHFVGTIHSFVNTFLATPYLRSLGFPPKAIDSDVTARVRRSLFGAQEYRSLKYYLEEVNRRSVDEIRITSADLTAPFGEKLLDLAGPDSSSYKSAAEVMRRSVELGYLHHDEIFSFANAMLDRHPETVLALRQRFPMVIVDEMQDTSKQQADLIARIFPPDTEECTVQRIGDPNQAIYGEQENGFPAAGYLSIADSFRFDQSIATLASPLALTEVQPSGLIGRRQTDKAAQHTFILFEPSKARDVLPAFARVCLEAFSDEEINGGKISVLGARHSVPDGEVTDGAHFPKIISDYFPDFAGSAHDSFQLQPTLQLQVEYARGLAVVSGGLSKSLENLAEAIIRVVNSYCSVDQRIGLKARRFRQLLELSAELPSGPEALSTTLVAALDPSSLLRRDSCLRLGEIVADLVRLVADRELSVEYLAETSETPVLGTPKAAKQSIENLFEFISEDGRRIGIEVASIHRAKGETHLATLILDTFERTRLMKGLLGPLTGKRARGNLNSAAQKRMRLGYVAATRPTRLLAVSASTVALGANDTAILKSINALEENGWKVVKLT